MQKDDIIFNLRIANKKLDEELHLYRNGTTEENLLELISEKDSEIEELKKAGHDHVDKLRRIAKSSGQLIAKNDALQKENVSLTKQAELANSKLTATKQQMDAIEKNEADKKLISSQREATSLEKELIVVQDKLRRSKHANTVCKEEYEAQLTKLREETDALSKENEALNHSIDLLIPEAEQFQELIEGLEDDACSRDTNIEKLQKRCAQLIQDAKTIKDLKKDLDSSTKRHTKDMGRKDEQIERKDEQIARYHAELERAQAFNGDLKDRISRGKQERSEMGEGSERSERNDMVEGGGEKKGGLKERSSNNGNNGNMRTSAVAAMASKARQASKPASSKKLTFCDGVENQVM